MRRNVPKKRKAQNRKPVRAEQAAAALRSADGYTNAVAYLGEASPLFSAGTFVRANKTADAELLTTAYRENWLAKRIIDMPAEDMTRAWITLTGDFTEDDLAEMRRAEAHHSIRRELADAIRWARLYGGAIAVIVLRGESGRMDEPLDLYRLMPDCFQGLLVLDRAEGVTPSMELEEDLDDPDFGLPKYYTVELDLEECRSIRIHHSRVLRFIGRELPRRETIRENYWGASELEHIWDELEKQNATSANIAQMVFQANQATLKMADFGDFTALSTDEAQNKIRTMFSAMNRIRTSYGLLLLQPEDALETHPYNFAGLREIYETFMMDMAGAAEIPATRLFGRSPQGFQATGESDMRNYYEMISGLQERLLRPALERLLPVMAVSCWGYVPEDLGFVFNPLATETPKEQAELEERLTGSVIAAANAGIISLEEAREELRIRGARHGLWKGIGRNEG